MGSVCAYCSRYLEQATSCLPLEDRWCRSSIYWSPLSLFEYSAGHSCRQQLQWDCQKSQRQDRWRRPEETPTLCTEYVQINYRPQHMHARITWRILDFVALRGANQSEFLSRHEFKICAKIVESSSIFHLLRIHINMRTLALDLEEAFPSPARGFSAVQVVHWWGSEAQP